MSAPSSRVVSSTGTIPPPRLPDAELLDLARLVASVAAGDEPAAAAAAAALRGRLPREAAYEATLQTYLFAGFPAAINGLLVLAESWPAGGSGVPVTAPADGASGEPAAGRWASWRRRGQALCARVYGSRYSRLRQWMRELSPELDEWMVVEGYGKTLSRPGLGAAERELCAVAALAARGAVRQLEPHLEGAERLGLPRGLVRAAARGALEHAPAGARERARALVERRAAAPGPPPAGEAA